MQHIIRASRSNISSMLLPIPSRLVFVIFILALFSAPGKAQNFAGAGRATGRKDCSGCGSEDDDLEVVNRSSLSAATADEIRRNLLTQLAALGVRFVGAAQASVNVRVSLSENLQSYLWVAEIRAGCESTCRRDRLPASDCSAVDRTTSHDDGAAQDILVVTTRTHSGCRSHRRQPGAHAGAGCEWRGHVPFAGWPLATRTIAAGRSLAAMAARSARKTGSGKR